MKIAWLTNNISQLGGVEQVICGLANYFSTELGHDVEIISINSYKGDAFYALDASVQIRHMGFDWRTQTFRKLLRAVGGILGESDADILLTCHPTISYAAVLNKRRFGGKIIVTEHITTDFYSRKRVYCNAAIFRFADQFVVLNDSDRAAYRKLGCSAIVIPNANFRPTAVRASLEEKLILAAGRLENVKGFDRLIAAFSKVSSRYPDWKLCICGSGTQEDQLRKQVRELDLSERVLFPGAVNNMPDYYRNAGLFALSSRCEGFPLVLVEAISYGLPSVCFEIPSTKELLAGGGGILVPQGDISSFAEGLEQLMSDDSLRSRMSDEAYEISKNYTLSYIAGIRMQLFQSLTVCK